MILNECADGVGELARTTDAHKEITVLKCSNTTGVATGTAFLHMLSPY